MSVFTPSTDQKYKDKRQFGTVWGSVIKTLGGAITTGAAAASQNIGGVSAGANLIGEGVKDFIGNVGQQKQVQQSGIQIPTQGFSNNNALTYNKNTNAASQAMNNVGYDTKAGYNQESETFRDKQGNVVYDQPLTFEQQAARQTIQPLNFALTKTKDVPIGENGKKINYLKFFS